MPIPYTVAQLNNRAVSQTEIANYTANDWYAWAMSNPANTFSALSQSSVIPRISVAAFNGLANGFDPLNPTAAQRQTLMTLTYTQLSMWLVGDTSGTTCRFISLTAQALNALQLSSGSALNSSLLTNTSTNQSGYFANLWVNWWNAHTSDRSSLTGAAFASGFTATRLSSIALSGITQSQFTAWLNYPSNTLSDLTATTLNNLANTGSALGSSALTAARFQTWMQKSNQSGFTTSNNFRYLSTNAVNALAQSAGNPLSASSLDQYTFGQWLSFTNTSYINGDFSSLNANTLNALALNPNNLLGAWVLNGSTWSIAVSQDKLNAWLSKTTINSFTDLSVNALNGMSQTLSLSTIASTLTYLTRLFSDTSWATWWTQHTSERALLNPSVFAVAFTSARLNSMSAQDLSAVTHTQFNAWLACNNVSDLMPTVLSTFAANGVLTSSTPVVSTVGLMTNGIVNNAQINVSGLELGATWEYSLDGRNWVTGGVAGATSAQFTLPQEGLYNLQVRQTRVAGFTSAVAALRVVLDSGTARTPVLSLAVDSGSSSTDGITNVRTINVAGLEPGATWEYSFYDYSTWYAGVGSSFSDVPAPINGAPLLVKVRQTDAAGHRSAQGLLIFTLDRFGPAAPRPRVQFSTDASTHNSLATVFVGTPDIIEATPLTWQYKRSWTTDTGVFYTDSDWINGPNSGSFTVTASGQYSVQLRRIDVAGNSSPVSTLDFHLGGASQGMSMAVSSGTSSTNKQVDGSHVDALINALAATPSLAYASGIASQNQLPSYATVSDGGYPARTGRTPDALQPMSAFG